MLSTDISVVATVEVRGDKLKMLEWRCLVRGRRCLVRVRAWVDSFVVKEGYR